MCRIISPTSTSSRRSLNNEPDELADETVTQLSDATVACPELLARLTDDLIAPEMLASTDAEEV
jgi:hypothetical protein